MQRLKDSAEAAFAAEDRLDRTAQARGAAGSERPHHPTAARILPLGRRHAPARHHRRRRLQAVHLPAAVLQAPLRRLRRGDAERARGVRRRRRVRRSSRRTTASRFRADAHWREVRQAATNVGRALQTRHARHRDGQPRQALRHLRRRPVDQQGPPLRRHAARPGRALQHAGAHASPTCPRTSSARATSTSSRSSPTTPATPPPSSTPTARSST